MSVLRLRNTFRGVPRSSDVARSDSTWPVAGVKIVGTVQREKRRKNSKDVTDFPQHQLFYFLVWMFENRTFGGQLFYFFVTCDINSGSLEAT